MQIPAELIDREPSTSEKFQELLRGASRPSLPAEVVADPDAEELETAWSQEFSAQARLTERQKNAIALILAGEKEVRIPLWPFFDRTPPGRL